MQKEPLLKIDSLSISFISNKQVKEVIHRVSYELNKNEIVGIVGKISSGHIWLHKDGEKIDLTKLSEKEYRKIRGNDIAMIFQEPMTSLNPVYTCGDQVMEAILLHDKNLVKISRVSKFIDPIVKLLVNGLLKKIVNIFIFTANILFGSIIVSLFVLYSILYFVSWFVAVKIGLFGGSVKAKVSSYLDKNRILLSPDSGKANNSIVEILKSFRIPSYNGYS